MLVKDNTRHIRALELILASCSAVTAYEVRDQNRFFMSTLLNGGFGSDDMTRALAALWAEHKASIYIPISGKWYARLKPTIDGRYAAYEVILTSNAKYLNTCAHVEHYNATGGYWYTPQHDLGSAGSKALNSSLFISIRSIVAAFNRACYIR